VVGKNDTLKKLTKKTHHDDIPEKIMQLADEGNVEALKIWDEIGTNLGIGITSLVNLLNVDSIVIGGGLSNAWKFFEKSMFSEIKKRALTGPEERLSIYPAALGDDAGILGCAYLSLKELKVFD
jgi:glucokinase